ncbi:MAG TPA: hypothetical protein VK922_01310 [Gemmatimonadaceae bacterium]|nr:hypothetical protein [Gemmatimonadaceae bacterium]
MRIDDAQREMRRAYRHGFAGQLVSGALWLIAAALATWGTPRAAILTLCVGGIAIFPATRLVLLLLGSRQVVSRENPLGQLAMQIAFTVPLAIPVILAATVAEMGWFFPAFMVIVGAHYLPFVFLYGMREFGVLGAALVVAGVALGMNRPEAFGTGAWITGALLIGFAIVALLRDRRVGAAEAHARAPAVH